MDKLLFGAAYYDEYMPCERLDQDIELMKSAGINVVRIAESTWSTVEPQSGVFDFTSIDRVLEAMHRAGIGVIVGTPTYAVPTWMVKEHPEVLANTPGGQNKYGQRQNMDITNPAYLFYCERVIRKILGRVADHPAVIGYQADNETKHYHTSGANVQHLFVKYLKEKFGDLKKINDFFGLSYWSNRVNSWEDFPSVDGTINASLASEFARFQRKLVTDFLSWQVSIINEYKRPGQFVTHNFDFEWRGYSHGVQPDVDHFEASKAFDIAGVDIYHSSQSDLTGCEISFGGDLARSLKRANYLVMETQAQAFPAWVPYPGQLRLQAFSHLASGANMVSYWHWHSLHNAIETYWKGLLSHDFGSNPTFEEAKTIGRDFERLGGKLINLRKSNRVAVLVSNESLTALNSFKSFTGGLDYNDVVRRLYDTLYFMNIGCDIVHPGSDNLEDYRLLAVPSLYCAPEGLLERLNRFVENGGHIVYAFRSGFCDEHVKVRAGRQPGVIGEACGVYYSQFVDAKNVRLKSDAMELEESDQELKHWIELLEPGTAGVLARYDHPHWGKYAAITQNRYGKGTATYLGCLPSAGLMKKVLKQAVIGAGLWGEDQELQFPLIVKSGTNRNDEAIRYYFNYSDDEASLRYAHKGGRDLLTNRAIQQDETLKIAPWGVCIIQEGG